MITGIDIAARGRRATTGAGAARRGLFKSYRVGRDFRRYGPGLVEPDDLQIIGERFARPRINPGLSVIIPTLWRDLYAAVSNG
jgi:hypothetical protein